MMLKSKQELSDVLKNVDWSNIPYHIDDDTEDWVDDENTEITQDNIPNPHTFIFGQKGELIYKGPAQKWAPAEFMGNIIFYTNYPGGRDVLNPQTKRICHIGEYAQSRWEELLENDELKTRVSELAKNNGHFLNDVEIAKRNMYLFYLFELGGVRKLELGLKELSKKSNHSIEPTPSGLEYLKALTINYEYLNEVLRGNNND